MTTCIGLYKIKSAKIPAWNFVTRAAKATQKQEGAHEAPALAEKLLATRGRISFLLGCSPRKAAHAPLNGPVPMHIEAALSKSSGFLKQERSTRYGGVHL